MKILVTGGAGFIGSHLTRLLMERGEDVIVLDNLATGLRENLPAGVILLEADVCSEGARKLMAAGGFDAIVHLAAQTMVDASIRDPLYDERNNIGGMVNVLEAARTGGVKRVVFSSTAAVYGDVPESALPIREDRTASPLSFYGLSKVVSEKYMELYHQLYGLDYVVLRFANVFGERQGEGGEGGVISIFTKKIAYGEGISIFGDGNQTRDFIYAGDIASGIYAALKTDRVNEVYNLSTETETSLKELVQLLGDVAGKPIQPEFSAPREGDIYRSVLSNRKAMEALRWKPEMRMKEALRRTYGHFLK